MENKKGHLIKKMRKISITLYLILLTITITTMVYATTLIRNVPNISQGFLPWLTAFLIINLMTGKKSNLDENAKWYKNKWGWLEFFLIWAIGLSLFPYLSVLNIVLFAK